MTSPVLPSPNDCTRRILVSEYVSGGAWPDGVPDGSLAAEGRAMLIALVTDLIDVAGVEVVTTWDTRLGDFPLPESAQLSVQRVSDPENESLLFLNLLSQVDMAIVIAPETDGVLTERSRTVLKTGCQLIGSAPDAVATCTDKLLLTETLSAAGVPCIPTNDLDLAEPAPAWPFPLVVKPRDGAGSQATFRLDDARSFETCIESLRESQTDSSFIQQPFVEGQPASAAAILSDRPDILPAGLQVLSDDGCFQYLGCNLPGPFDGKRQAQINEVIRRCAEEFAGLKGYVGFDLIVPTADDQLPVLVEINPRLTTGYLAWRQWTTDNLAERILSPSGFHEELCWQSGSVQFRVADFG